MNRNAVLLLSSIGLTGIGSWIYFIALNLIIFNQTGSAAAVGLLYIIRPAAALLTSLWCGSLVDRVQKKGLLLFLTFAQSLLVAGIGLFPDILWASYLFVFLLQVLSSILQPAVMSFTAQLIPVTQLQRFNAVRSLLDSGSFLLGPAIAGFILMTGSPATAIYINALALIFSAVLVLFISFNEELEFRYQGSSFSLKTGLIEDWKSTLRFRETHPAIWLIYLVFTLFIVMQTAVDSLEVSFSKEVLLLSDHQYGLLVSCAGAGILVGSFINIVLSQALKISAMIGAGSVTTAAGYLIFATAPHFLIANIGVFILGIALAFANTGFLTLIQQSIPVKSIGRVVSFFHLIEAFLIIVTTAILACFTFYLSIKFAVLSGILVMLLVTVFLTRNLPHPQKVKEIKKVETGI
nr:MFS transporter [Jeotgalibacillus malaysiensis]